MKPARGVPHFTEMMVAASLLLAFYFSQVVEAQYPICANQGTGPCLPNGQCPPGQSCIFAGAGAVMTCCENSQIIIPGAATTMAPTVATAAPVVPPTTTCFDRVNPRTGVSDCRSLAYLCNNAVYYALMTEQCPLTCNRCTGTAGAVGTVGTVVGTGACRDLVDYRTGVSNCAQMAPYCRNAVYANLMRQQCPRTCGYCV